MTKTMKPALRLNSPALLSLGRIGHLNLASNAAARTLRGDVPPGNHQGEVTFRLVYDINVGEDHEAEVAASVPWKSIAGALFGKLNAATRDRLIRELLESADEGGFQVRQEATDPEAEAALAALMGRTRKIVSGRVTGSAVLLPVEG